MRKKSPCTTVTTTTTALPSAKLNDNENKSLFTIESSDWRTSIKSNRLPFISENFTKLFGKC